MQFPCEPIALSDINPFPASRLRPEPGSRRERKYEVAATPEPAHAASWSPGTKSLLPSIRLFPGRNWACSSRGRMGAVRCGMDTTTDEPTHTCTDSTAFDSTFYRTATVQIWRFEMSAMPTMPVFTHSGGALIASPDSALREQVLHRLNGRCRPVQQALGGADALAKLEKGDWQVLFLDRRLPDLDAEELIAIIQRRFPGTQVVMLDSDEPHSDERAREDQAREREARPDAFTRDTAYDPGAARRWRNRSR